MEKIKNFNEFVNDEILIEKTPKKEWDDMLLEMAQIGTFNKYTIIVWTNDSGNIPHFHIVDSSTRGKKFHTCIKIEKAEYFHHSGKEDVLNQKERKELMKFLNSNDKWGEQIWVVLLKEWERNNSNISIDINQTIPDYTNIK
jgi:hypothetical protein